MSERDERLGASQDDEDQTPEEAEANSDALLRPGHAARTRSAAARAAAISHYIKEYVAGDELEEAGKNVAWKPPTRPV